MSHASPVRSLGTRAKNSPFVSLDPEFAAVTGRCASTRSRRLHRRPRGAGLRPGRGRALLHHPARAGERARPQLPRVDVRRVALDGDRFPLDPDRVSTVRENANVANGMALDLEGRLVACEQGTRSQHAAITCFDRASGTVETLVDGWGGLRLNSPNDVVVKSDGTIWFTDPGYGHLQGFRPEPLSATTSTALIRAPAACRWSPTRSTSPTASPSRPTSGSCTSATAAPTRRRAATTRPTASHQSVRRRRRAPPRERAPLLRHHSGLPRWDQGRRRGPRLCLRLQRRPGP